MKGSFNGEAANPVHVRFHANPPPHPSTPPHPLAVSNVVSLTKPTNKWARNVNVQAPTTVPGTKPLPTSLVAVFSPASRCWHLKPNSKPGQKARNRPQEIKDERLRVAALKLPSGPLWVGLKEKSEGSQLHFETNASWVWKSGC